jgi:hypothetical protein
MTLLWRSGRATKQRCGWSWALQGENAAAKANTPTMGRPKTTPHGPERNAPCSCRRKFLFDTRPDEVRIPCEKIGPVPFLTWRDL